MAVREAQAVSEASPPLLGWPVSRLPLWLRLLLIPPAVAIVVGAALAGSREYPRSGAPVGTVLEERIAESMHDPTVASWDGAIIGDLLVERFYILDVVTGDRYVADFLKGRIDGVEVVQREDLSPSYVFLLNTKDMRRDKPFFSAYFKSVVHADEAANAFYLGVITPAGERDAFPVNYNGDIPAQYVPFNESGHPDPYSFMVKLNFKDVAAPRGYSIEGYTYVLNTSDQLPLFKNELKLDKTLFVSQLVIVDTTSRANKTTYFKLLEQYPRSGG